MIGRGLSRDEQSRVPAPGRAGLSSPPAGRVRYARVANSDTWLYAQGGGFVGSILDAIDDGQDRVLLAWPSRPDSGFVAAAVALREARATGRLGHATLGFWPWRAGAVHPARSILVHPKDIASTGARAVTELRGRATWADSRLAHESLSMLELRLNDLAPSRKGQPKAESKESPSISPKTSARERLIVRSPTLLETTVVFTPARDASCAAYVANKGQILRRVRQHTHIDDDGSTMDSHVGAVSDPLRAPFAIFGLESMDRARTRSCLAFRRFADIGLDAVVADLTWTSRASLGSEWEQQLASFAATLSEQQTGRASPVIVVCEEAAVLRRAVVALRVRHGCVAHHPVRKQGSLLLTPGIFEGAIPQAAAESPKDVRFEADIKDASLVPLRRSLIELSRRLGEAGHGREAVALRSGLRALRSFASLPIGVAEAQCVAAILFDGDGREEIEVRSRFFATAALQPLADAQDAAPTFATEIRASL